VLQPERQLGGGEPGRPDGGVRARRQGRQRRLQRPYHAVEADAGQAHLRLELVAGLGDQHDVAPRLDHVPGVLGEASAQPHVHGAAEVTGGELGGVAGVDHDGTRLLPGEHLVERQECREVLLVEQRPVAPVEVGVEGEVRRADGLALGDDAHEVVDRHRSEGVIRAALIADRARHGRRHVAPARRAGTVGGEHPGGVRQREQLRVQRAVQHGSEVGGPDARRHQQVGPAHVADEQRVARQHAVRLGIVTVLPDDDADRLGRVAGSGADLQHHLPEHEAVAIVDWLDGKVEGPDGSAVADGGAGAGGQLEMAGQEVGVDVGLDDALDADAGGISVGHVAGDVALGVDHHRPAGGLVGDEI
jgi:hypothetical protein